MKQISVFIVDEHAFVREGIRALLEKLPELKVVAESSAVSEALRLIRQHQPDVAVIKCAMSAPKDFELISRVKNECPAVQVIVLSTRDDEESLMRAVGCGAAGYLTLTASAAELGLAIKTVASGKSHISSSAKKSLTEIVRHRIGTETIKGLTPRQREVLKLIAEGNSTKQIARILKISVKTVETHRTLLSERLDIHNTAGLVSYALKAGLIRLDD